ncbi:hypothetical protein [Variovorax saccharolyticus]|uniref:hypothetical protein n=1 Tax=Variovorax saccharolyticus TaxID=3053516 RepID=UPI00257888AE|nr:hypothetical protein [Variovorax sp. J31P216]MDM0025741.1 hypothetical protein [Variovorax sp. J31P216]
MADLIHAAELHTWTGEDLARVRRVLAAAENTGGQVMKWRALEDRAAELLTMHLGIALRSVISSGRT